MAYKFSILVFFLSVSFEKPSFGSCCSFAFSNAQSLLKHERAIAQFSLNYKHLLGFFDEKRNIIFNRSLKIPKDIFEPSLLLMTRIFLNIEPFIKIPFIIQKNNNRSGSGISDCALGFRTNIFNSNYLHHMPSLFYIFSWQIPSGKERNSQNKDPLAITGLGYHILFNTLGFEKDLRILLSSLSYSLGIPIDHLKTNTIREGLIHQISSSFGFSMPKESLASLIIGLKYNTSMKENNKKIIDSEKYVFNSSLAFSKKISSKISWQTSLGFDLPIDFLGKNINSFFIFNMGLRLGVF